MSLNLDPQEIYNRLVKAGEEWSRLNQIASLLEENKKTQLNQLKVEYLDEKKSAAESEARALGSAEMSGYNQRMTEARKEANNARVKYDAAKAWFEGMRSLASTMRQEMKMVGGHK